MNRRTLIKILGVGVPLILLITLAIGCAAQEQTTAVTQEATATKGDLVLDITAVGNLAYSQSEELSFDTNGTVSEVLVDVGDSVTEGQVLARLNITEWQQTITGLESTLVSRQQALTQAQQNLTKAERDVVRMADAVAAAEQAVVDAEYNISVQERAVIQAQIDVTNAELNYQDLLLQVHFGTGDKWVNTRLHLAEQSLELARARLDDAYRNVEKAKEAVVTAEKAVESAKLDVIDAQTAVTIAQSGVTKAEQDVADAQTALDDAKTTHPELTAPFDGLIITINTKAGSEVYKGGAIVTIVDPDKFKAEILVGETDITSVKLNGDAAVELDALPGVSIPAKVTSISPTATVSQGVVSYQVTVELSTERITQQGSTPSGSAFPFTPDELPEGFTPGQLPEGFTPGQLPEGFTLPEGVTPGQGGIGTQLSGDLSLVQLRQGLTASVSIIVDRRIGVIYVPNQAIKTVKGDTIVNVIKDGVITERSIKTGLVTAKYTEVTEGLEEGERVVYTKSTSSGTSNQFQGPGGGFMMR